MSSDDNNRQSPLKLKVLDPPQRALWKELSATPRQFTLYGETALALRFGHRRSVDFEFFSTESFDPHRLKDEVPFLAAARITQLAPGTLTCIVERGGPVQVSFFCPRKTMRMIGHPRECHRPTLRLASLIDIAATKLAVLPARCEPKDYLDIHALISRRKLDVLTMLVAASFVFEGQDFNPLPRLQPFSMTRLWRRSLSASKATCERPRRASTSLATTNCVASMLLMPKLGRGSDDG
jgi:hypothetical protein